MPVKNGEKYIADAIESVLQQSYTNFEFLIFDDDSTDSTLKIINGYSDSRIKIFNGKNGFIANLNSGIEISNCLYIARMDADDIMSPKRLETQLEVMENQNVDVCSSWITMFGDGIEPVLSSANYEGIIQHPLIWLLYGNFVAHPTTMIRKEFLMEKSIRYDSYYPCAEDYKLWVDIAKENGIFYVHPEPLLKYRISMEQVTQFGKSDMNQQSLRIHNEIYDYLLSHY